MNSVASSTNRLPSPSFSIISSLGAHRSSQKRPTEISCHPLLSCVAVKRPSGTVILIYREKKEQRRRHKFTISLIANEPLIFSTSKTSEANTTHNNTQPGQQYKKQRNKYLYHIQYIPVSLSSLGFLQ